MLSDLDLGQIDVPECEPGLDPSLQLQDLDELLDQLELLVSVAIPSDQALCSLFLQRALDPTAIGFDHILLGDQAGIQCVMHLKEV